MRSSLFIVSTFLLFFFFSREIISQTNPIPNYSFENWAGGEPVSWQTNNNSTPNSVTLSSDAYDGLFSALLKKATSVSGDCNAGLKDYRLEIGFPINKRYDTLKYFSKIIIDQQNLSSCVGYFASIKLYKSNNLIASGGNEVYTNQVSEWAERKFIINYQQDVIPDSAIIYFVGGDSNAVSTVQILLDNISLIGQNKLTITRPVAGDKWLAGSIDSVKWEGGDESDSVSILLSVDDGNKYETLDLDIKADTGIYIFEISDTLLSTKCKIKVSSQTDNNNEAISDVFKIKGYELTRDSIGQYERFRVSEDGWSFSNSESNIWPTTWWGQFNYQSGIDPYTGLTYLQEDPFLSAQPGDFPDWPLFVETFGEEKCYWDKVQGIYLVKALTKWASIKEDWGGSCTGFAISSFLAFDDKVSFRNAFPDIQNFQNLYDLTINDANRKLLNKLWLSQFGKQHKAYQNQQASKDPRQTLAELKSMFLADNRDDSYLYMKKPNKSSAHAVSPYKLWRFPGSNGEYTLWIYDNNKPNGSGVQVFIDSANNTWEYVTESWDAGNDELYLMDPVSSYYQRPILNSSLNSNVASKITATGYIEIYNTLNASIMISDGIGNTIGFKDGKDFNTLPDGIPIIPITSKYHPPIGYYLPDGKFNIQIKEFSDSSAYLNVFEDSTTYGYSRKDALSTQQDNIKYGDGLSVGNPDNSIKNISLKTIISGQDNEKVFYINNVTEGGGDSLKIKEESRKNLLLVNYGSATSYELRLKFLSAEGQAVFEYPALQLSGISTHNIKPIWSDLSVVPVYIDLGNDDTIDDTLYVDNTVDVEDQGSLQIPDDYRLEQNYPNPFNPTTTIKYSIPKAGLVTIRVYNIIGEEIATLVNEEKTIGNYNVEFDATQLPSGIYLYQLNAADFVETKKMVLLK